MTFSVIIPAYNAEKTLRRCIDSLLCNGREIPFELIVVDDGSADSTASIAEGCRDPRIRLIRQENRGASAARNTGMDAAQNEILCFVDADDYVTPDYLAQLNAAFETHRADAVFFGYNRVELSGAVIPHGLPEMTGDYLENLAALTRNDTFGYTWIKAIRRDFVGEARFDPALPLFEDEVFAASIFKTPCKLVFVNSPLYNYVITEGSLSLKYHPDFCSYLDRVYEAWAALLGDRLPQVVTENANHWVIICQYYGLERATDTVAFYKTLSRSDFFRASTVRSGFAEKVRSGAFAALWLDSKLYKAKAFLSRILKKRT